MPEDSYWSHLVYKVDSELQKLEALAQPDELELALKEKMGQDPTNLKLYYDLAEHLCAKNRSVEAIPVLLDLIAIDRNWENKKGYNKLLEVFKEVGTASEEVKVARKKLASIMF